MCSGSLSVLFFFHLAPEEVVASFLQLVLEILSCHQTAMHLKD